MPPAKEEETDAEVAFTRDEVALITANKNIVAGRKCIADVRKQYSGPVAR